MIGDEDVDGAESGIGELTAWHLIDAVLTVCSWGVLATSLGDRCQEQEIDESRPKMTILGIDVWYVILQVYGPTETYYDNNVTAQKDADGTVTVHFGGTGDSERNLEFPESAGR